MTSASACFAASLMLAVAPTAALADFEDSRLTVQLDRESLTPEAMPKLLADVRAAGADSVQIAYCEFYEDGERRARRSPVDAELKLPPDGENCPEENQRNARKCERVYEKGLFAHSSANPSAITCCMTASVSCSDTSRALRPCTRVSAFW